MQTIRLLEDTDREMTRLGRWCWKRPKLRRCSRPQVTPKVISIKAKQTWLSNLCAQTKNQNLVTCSVVWSRSQKTCRKMWWSPSPRSCSGLAQICKSSNMVTKAKMLESQLWNRKSSPLRLGSKSSYSQLAPWLPSKWVPNQRRLTCLTMRLLSPSPRRRLKRKKLQRIAPRSPDVPRYSEMAHRLGLA